MSSKTSDKRFQSLTTVMSLTILTIIFLLPFHAFFTGWAASNFGYFDQIRIWKEIIISLLAVGCSLLLIVDKRLRRQFVGSKTVLLIALFMILGLLRTFYGYEKGLISNSSIMYGIIADFRYLTFFVVVWLVASRTRMLSKWWAFTVLTPATLVVMFGLLQQFVLERDFLRHFGYGPNTLPAFQSVDNKESYMRAQSTLRGPNPLGAYLTFIITFLVALWHKLKSYSSSFVFLIVASTFLLFFTYSRSAWVGLVVSLATWTMLVVKDKKVLKKIAVVVLVGVTLLVCSTVLLRNNDFVQNTIFHTDEKSQSSTSTNFVRTTALKSGLQDVWRHPLGQGLGSAGPASERGASPKIAENYYIQIAQEVGIFGLLIYIAISLGVIVRLLRIKEQLLPQVLIASFVGITVINMVSHAWMDDTLSLIWWGLAGIALAPAIMKVSHEKQTKNEKVTS